MVRLLFVPGERGRYLAQSFAGTTHMVVKLVSETWREDKAEEKRQFEAGEISEGELCLDQLFPDQFIADTEPLLLEFVSAIATTGALDYESVMNSIKSLVEKLNEINTMERL